MQTSIGKDKNGSIKSNPVAVILSIIVNESYAYPFVTLQRLVKGPTKSEKKTGNTHITKETWVHKLNDHS